MSEYWFQANQLKWKVESIFTANSGYLENHTSEWSFAAIKLASGAVGRILKAIKPVRQVIIKNNFK